MSEDLVNLQENNSNSLDNGFEKVDAEGSEGENLVTSTSLGEEPLEEPQAEPVEEEQPEEGISSNPPPEDDAPLVDLGFSPVSSTREPEPSPPSPPAPAVQSISPTVQIPTKKSSPVAGI